MRRISIDIQEAVNGYRLDVYDTAKPLDKHTTRVNIERWNEVLSVLLNWIKTETNDHKHKLEII